MGKGIYPNCIVQRADALKAACNELQPSFTVNATGVAISTVVPAGATGSIQVTLRGGLSRDEVMGSL